MSKLALPPRPVPSSRSTAPLHPRPAVATSERFKHLQIHVSDRLAPGRQRFAEGLGRRETAAHRDAVIGCGIIGQHGFSLVAPSPQDALQAPQLTVVIDESARFGQHASGTSALKRSQGVGLLPALLQAERLRDEFSVYQAPHAGLNSEIISARWGAFLLDAHPHLVD